MTLKAARLATLLIPAALTMIACEPAATQNTAPSDAATTQPTTWAAKHVDAVEASALLKAKPETLVLDIRTPGEIKKGHIKNAVYADYKSKDFRTQLEGLDRTAPYLVHCGIGGRSTAALTTLEEMGFENVTHMDGGIKGWEKAGLPVVGE